MNLLRGTLLSDVLVHVCMAGLASAAAFKFNPQFELTVYGPEVYIGAYQVLFQILFLKIGQHKWEGLQSPS